ncbi:MAG TPA: DUF3857 domain-containing protein [Gemmatimonas aurantiaca]|uniref:Transglutaminase-like domain-containing protein n=2 Tax=Gemmatimonas aurantiaca TaxID=173480 RepID=C1ABF9_GEMAT|nr:DUF3857 domain-containing transglutaminase family protein [Gemmatimonas aurantiaca]BAH39836.1 hypothetical protein GAU_2794 [Gemmatimonas aurantiaca T-27]HCT58153.1 DUF3857 domain-containing protein [Gemmatimonas aurantiaca]
MSLSARLRRLLDVLTPAFASCLAITVGAGVAQGQGLPKAPSDSITALALDPTRVRGAPFVVLLDEGVFRVEHDGTWRNEVRQVMQVLDANGVGALAERALTFARSHQRLTVRWVRVLRPNGEVISDRAAQEQDADVPAAMNAPIYQDQRVRRLSLAGVAPNTIVDIAFTLEEQTPQRPGDFLHRWALNGLFPVRRSLFTLDVPTGYMPTIVERNLVARRQEEDRDGRRRYRWMANDQTPLRAEPFAADSNGVAQSITVSGAGTWSAVAAWYNTLARDRYLVSPAVGRVVDSVVAAASPRSRADSLRAWHRWVTQDIRYVSVALGIGGYQPRTADEVLRTGFGDCKDKASLFIAVLRRAGIEAEPVVLALTGKPDPAVPSIFQFNHVIAAVRDGASWQYTDLTADIFPYSEIPESYQGAFAIRVTAAGGAERVTLPTTLVAFNHARQQVVARIDASGAMVGTVREAAQGASAPPLRALLAAAEDPTRRPQAVRGFAQRIAGNEAAGSVTIDSLGGSRGRDLATPPQLQYHIRLPDVVRTVSGVRLLRLPLSMRGPASQLRILGGQIDSVQPRRLPIDAARIIPPAAATIEWRVTLPDGWTVDLPPNVNATSFFGRYRSTWTLEGQELRLVRELEGGRGVFGPQRLPEVRVWLKSVGADDQEFLTLKAGRAP